MNTAMKNRSVITLVASFALLILMATPLRIDPGQRTATPKPVAQVRVC